MDEFYLHVVFILEMQGQMLRTIDRAVLPAGTAEGHLQVSEIAFNKPLYVMVYQPIHRIEEGEYLAVLLEEVNDGLVQARESLILVIRAGVMGRTAVEDITSSVTGRIFGKTALIRERVDRY